MKIKGTIEVIEIVDNKVYPKTNVVIKTNEQYPQSILIEFGDKVMKVLDNYKVGQSVEVSINLRGRKWTNSQGEDKYFNTIQGWKIESVEENLPFK